MTRSLVRLEVTERDSWRRRDAEQSDEKQKTKTKKKKLNLSTTSPLNLLINNKTDLYAIVKTTEKLERAYVRDAIPASEYEPACSRLIGQFRTLWETLRPDGSGGGGASAAAVVVSCRGLGPGRAAVYERPRRALPDGREAADVLGAARNGGAREDRGRRRRQLEARRELRRRGSLDLHLLRLRRRRRGERAALYHVHGLA